MNTLTGNTDTDVNIINSLTLQELRLFCRINSYSSDLCQNHIVLKSRMNHVKKKVDHLLNLINTRENGILLSMNDEYQTFKVFNDLMISIKISDDAQPEDDEQNPSSVLNDHIVYTIQLYKYSQGYIFQYYLGRDLDAMDHFNEDRTIFSTYHINSLKEFLLNIFYDELILNF